MGARFLPRRAHALTHRPLARVAMDIAASNVLRRLSMTRQAGIRIVLLLATFFLSGVAQAQLQYFGYVGNADDDPALEDTKSFTNFAHLSTTDNIDENKILDRTTAAAQKGLKVTIDVGQILWCPIKDAWNNIISWSLCRTPTNPYLYRDRWNYWFTKNKSVLTYDKLIAFSVLDEPFRWQADMNEFITAVQLVKDTFRNTSPYWVPKVWMIEAACAVRGYCPSIGLNNNAFALFDGSRLTEVDWVGIDDYGVHPRTDPGYQDALYALKSKFPGKKIVYVMDAWWNPGVHEVGFNTQDYGIMASIAREYYDMARMDPNAVMMGGFIWPESGVPGELGAEEFPCTVIKEHIAIGRAITGKSRTRLYAPIGYLDWIDSNGIATGWACDPDGAICEDVQVLFSPSGLTYSIVGRADQPSEDAVNNLCKTGKAHRFRQWLPPETKGREIRAYGQDLNAGTSLLPGWQCAQNPACVW
jgi:hypothetical protein